MCIRRKQSNINIKVEDQEIEEINKTKYLGVQLDKKLLFTEHVKYVKKKANMARKFIFIHIQNKPIEEKHKNPTIQGIC